MIADAREPETRNLPGTLRPDDEDVAMERGHMLPLRVSFGLT